MTEEEIRQIVREELLAVVQEVEAHPDATGFVSSLLLALESEPVPA